MENSSITIYLHIYGQIIDPYNDLLPVGLIAQLVEHCTDIAEVRVGISVQAFQIYPISLYLFVGLTLKRTKDFCFNCISLGGQNFLDSG